jgi:hypothetical protein
MSARQPKARGDDERVASEPYSRFGRTTQCLYMKSASGDRAAAAARQPVVEV